MIEAIFYYVLAVAALFIIVRWLILKLNKEVCQNNLVEVKNNAESYAMELSDLFDTVNGFVNEHNSWHNRKIALYYDKDGWHCLYADEMPQGNVLSEQEEINTQNENNDENNQSIKVPP